VHHGGQRAKPISLGSNFSPFLAGRRLAKAVAHFSLGLFDLGGDVRGDDAVGRALRPDRRRRLLAPQRRLARSKTDSSLLRESRGEFHNQAEDEIFQKLQKKPRTILKRCLSFYDISQFPYEQL
jgi:hypothetical protein